jgi:cytochrome P450
MGTPIMNYLGKFAKDTLRFMYLSDSKLKAREALEIENRKSGNSARKDIFHYLFDDLDIESGRGYNRNEFHADAQLLIAAGSDGTSTAMSSAMFYLLRNPETMKKLEKELSESVSGVEEFRLPKINQLPYLHGVMEEALRLSPPFPSALPREVLKGGMVIDGHFIPAGVGVEVPPYSIHRNEEYFPDAWAFKPERWLPYADGIVTAKRAFFAFGLGSMNCIGKNVAYLAMKLAMAKLLYEYEVKVPDDVGLVGGGRADGDNGRLRAGEFQLTDWMVGYRDGPIVQFRKRDRGERSLA